MRRFIMVNGPSDPMQVLRTLIKDIKFAMVTTRNKMGLLVSRPLTTQALDDNDINCLWFFVPKSGSAFDDLTSDQNIGVAYSDPEKDTYVSISGIAVLEDSLQHKQNRWSINNQLWFPNGPTDPDVALLRVDIQRAHYWDVKKNKLMKLYDIAMATLTDTSPFSADESVEVPILR